MGAPVIWSINPTSSIAVYIQIENQICFAIVAETIKARESLPSVREMSETLKVNANTVTKAYRDLELKGLVATKRGVGVKVTDKAKKLCKDEVLKMVQAHLCEATGECMASGFSNTKIRQVLSEAINSANPPYTNSNR